MDRVTAQGSSTRLEALPIGIAPDEFAGYIEKDEATQAAFEKLRRRYRGRRILLGVDRLDYTKGIPQRLRAYRKLLERAPHLRGQVVLVQVAVPSRETHSASTSELAQPRQQPGRRGQRRVRDAGVDAGRLHTPRHHAARSSSRSTRRRRSDG